MTEQKKSYWVTLGEVALVSLILGLVGFSFAQLWREFSQYRDDVESFRKADLERRYAIERVTQLVADQQEVLTEQNRSIGELISTLKEMSEKSSKTIGNPPETVHNFTEAVRSMNRFNESVKLTQKRIDLIQKDIRQIRMAKQ